MSHGSVLLVLSALLAALALAPPPAVATMSCEDLTTLVLPDTTITSATSVTPPAIVDGIPVTVPFCRVAATLMPSFDSNIRVEVWLPSPENWNGRYLGTGNGGYAGTIRTSLLADGLRRGFATANTDMGTSPSTSLFGDPLVGHPEKWVDWGYRATHEMTVVSKEIIAAFYGQHARSSYFTGCSTGGQQALMEAQRFPDDYDGILSGAPAHDRTHLHSAVVWNYAAFNEEPGSFTPPAKLALLNEAVLAQCGTQDGGLASDPFLADPRDCHFDPAELQCSGDDAPDCLTATQVEAMQKIYAGPRNPRTGELIYRGVVRGSETNALGLEFIQGLPEPAFDGLFKWVFGLSWDWQTFDFDHDMATVDAALESILNATSADLSQFETLGHKLIVWHGWADPLIPPQGSIDYYERIVATQSPSHGHGRGKGQIHQALRRTKDFARLFMAPGVAHCFGGSGPDAFGGAFQAPSPQTDPEDDMLSALVQWVEHGVPPERIIATKYVSGNPANGIAMQRPLCAYPRIAMYKGVGDPDDAGSFMCVNDLDGADVPTSLNPDRD